MDITVFGKNIVRRYAHYIMRIDCAGPAPERREGCVLRPAAREAFAREIAGAGSTVTEANLRRLLARNGERCEGFVFTRAGEPIGSVCVLYRGGNDLEYRVRRAEAYVFGVYIREAERGHGYAGEMLAQLAAYLRGKGIGAAVLAVSKKNAPAIRAYEKCGFSIERECAFTRVVKFNVPYLSV